MEKKQQNKNDIGPSAENGQPVYINPLTDFGIKRVFFTTVRGPERLVSFLRAFMPDIMRDIACITYRFPNFLDESEPRGKSMFDIYCMTNTGRQIIIVLQLFRRPFSEIELYAHESYMVNSVMTFEDLDNCVPTIISFNILDYDSDRFPHSDKAFHEVKLKTDDNEVVSEREVFCFLEVNKYVTQDIGQLKGFNFPDEMQKWAFLLKNMHQMEEQDLSGEEGIFRGLFEDCRFSELTDKEKYKNSLENHFDTPG